MSDALRIGQVGLGYWGRNLARNFNDLADLCWLCDPSVAACAEFAERYPNARVTRDFAEMLADDELDAVVIATPVPTHYPLAKQALEAGKHVFVEKPPTAALSEMEALLELAGACDLVLMPGHLLLYHPAVQKMKEIIDSGELGEILYIYGERQNLGKVLPDEDVLLSLGVHDLSVILGLLQERPIEAITYGQDSLKPGVKDVVFCFLRFASGRTAHLHLSWLDPRKRRRLTVVGRNQVIVFDDAEPQHKIALYSKCPESMYVDSYGKWLSNGEPLYPDIPSTEPLQLECQHFLRLVREGSDGREMHDGLEVMHALEMLTASQ